MKKTAINPQITNDLKQYQKLLKAKGFNIQKIILFGSVAKGKNSKYSDIDIAVVSSKFGKDYQKEMVKLMILSHQINNAIEPHPLNPSDLKSRYSALADEIRKHGLMVK